MTLNFGVTCGWSSSSLVLLQSENSPLPTGKITADEASLIAALMSAGGLIGNLIITGLTERYGRRMPLLLFAIPQIVR